jgi:hypothetical protein
MSSSLKSLNAAESEVGAEASSSCQILSRALAGTDRCVQLLLRESSGQSSMGVPGVVSCAFEEGPSILLTPVESTREAALCASNSPCKRLSTVTGSKVIGDGEGGERARCIVRP